MSRLGAWIGSRKVSAVWRGVALIQLAVTVLDIAVRSYANAFVIALAAAASGCTSLIFARTERRALPEARTRSKRP